jgi:copper(I)-binding protein
MRRPSLLCCTLLPVLFAAAPALAQIDSAPDTKNVVIDGAPRTVLPDGTGPTLRITGAWTPATTKRGNAPAYLVIDNTGAADTLIGASCSNAQGTVMKMANPPHLHYPGLAPMGSDETPILISIDVPANGHLELKPGGDHLVLQDVSTPSRPGDTIGCVLQFRSGGPMDVRLQVRTDDSDGAKHPT